MPSAPKLFLFQLSLQIDKLTIPRNDFMNQYQNHPYADLYPSCSQEQLRELSEDIKQHGLHHPITLYQGQILDGRHRYLACQLASVEAAFVTFNGTDEQAFHFALSENIKRRNTTASQRAASAVLATPLWKKFQDERPVGRPVKEEEIVAILPQLNGEKTRDKVANLFGISGRYVSDAKALTELSTELDNLLTKDQPEWQRLAEQHARLRTVIAELHSGNIEMSEAKRWKDAFSHGKLLLETELAKRKKPELILADPPWRYEQCRDDRAIENQYPTATIEEICSHAPLTSDNAILFLWATAPKLSEALTVMSAWGFTYRTSAVWDKQKIGMGDWFRGQHEHLLVGVKGCPKATPEPARVSSIFSESRTSHSKKPECVYQWIENAFPALEKLEMYARTKRDGWKQWGNEV